MHCIEDFACDCLHGYNEQIVYGELQCVRSITTTTTTTTTTTSTTSTTPAKTPTTTKTTKERKQSTTEISTRKESPPTTTSSTTITGKLKEKPAFKEFILYVVVGTHPLYFSL